MLQTGTEPAEKSPLLSIADVREVTKKWLLLKDDLVIDITVASVVANMLESDPLWMLLIAPPSSAKTELLRAAAGSSSVYLLSSLTPTTFISGMKPKDNSNPGLLFKLNDKILVVKDFGTIMTLRNEQRSEILSQLREIYDGTYTKAFGTGKTITWEGKMGFAAGATPIIDQYSSLHQALGERFLQFRIKGDNPQEVAKKAKDAAGKETTMRKELKETYGRFIDQFKQMEGKGINITIPPELEEKIINLACFCAQARTGVIRDRYTQAIEVLPEAEGPGRLIKQFTNLGIALTMINHKDTLDGDIYRLLRRVGKDTLPALRMKIIHTLWQGGSCQGSDVWLKTKEVANNARLPTTTARINLEDLQSIRLAERDIPDDDGGSDSDKTVPYRWQLSKECCKMLDDTGFMEGEEALEPVPF